MFRIALILWSLLFILGSELNAQTIDLLFPSNEAEIGTDEITFSWESAGGTAMSYQLVIFSCGYESSIALDEYTLGANDEQGSCEHSGLALSPVDSASFITVDNGAATSEILNDNGTDVGGLAFTGLPGSDLEGISYLYDDYYVIVEEDLGSVIYFQYDYSVPEQTYTAADVWIEYIPSVASNSWGMEGVTYDPLTEKIYAVKEKYPLTILEWDVPDLATGLSTITGLNEPFDLEDKAVNEYGITDVSGLFHLNQSEDFIGTVTGTHLLLLCQESQVVLELDLEGNEISRLDIPMINQAEGIAFKNGSIYIVSELNQGQPCSFATFQNPNYSPPKPNADNTVQITTSSIESAIIQSGSFSAGEHYCWQVIGTDANGTVVESEVFSFDVVQSGCTDASACNYDAAAVLDDGSCEYESCADCEGIPNGAALPGTECDDMDSATVNDVYDADCECAGVILLEGCTDASACNYNPSAETDDGSCEYESCADCEGLLNGTALPGTGCDDMNSATIDDVYDANCNCIGTAQILGCTDVNACNYNSSANTEDNSCLYQNNSCDDGLINTENDVINEDCVCEGELVNSIESIDYQISLYPNPASEWIEVEKPANGYINIYGSEGLLIISEYLNSSRTRRIDISSLPIGIYYYVIVSERSETSGVLSVIR